MSGSGAPPDLAPTRRNGVKKYGFGLNIEAVPLRRCRRVWPLWVERREDRKLGVYRDRPLTEWRPVAEGLALETRRDTIGVAAVSDYLSGDHRAFLAAGGYGFIIGDGRLNYAPEQIVEAYYSFRATDSWTVTGDYNT